MIGKTFPSIVFDRNSGVYNLTYLRTMSAFYYWDVQINSMPVWNHLALANIPWYVQLAPAQSFPPYCYLEPGLGLYGGKLLAPIIFTIVTRDQYYNQRIDGRLADIDKFMVSIRGVFGKALQFNTTISANLTDPNNGNYQVSYITTVSGTYVVSVFLLYNCQPGLSHSLCGTNLTVPTTPSPLRASVIADSIYARLCFGFGSAYQVGVAGNNETFYIQAVDIRGNYRTDGADIFVIRITGPQIGRPWNFMIAENRTDGTYKAMYLFTIAGMYRMSITLGGVFIKQSPSNLTVTPAVVEPRLCAASGSALTISTVGITSYFVMNARDRYGNIQNLYADFPSGNVTCLDSIDVVEGDRPRWKKTLVCGYTLTLSVQALTGGRYLLGYTSTRSGNFRIDVAIRSQAISGSPFRNLGIMPQEMSTGNSTAVGIQPAYADDWYLEQSTGRIIPVGPNFAVVVRDSFGNQRLAASSVVLTVVAQRLCNAQRVFMQECSVGQQFTTVPSYVVDNGDGSYGVQYTATFAGDYMVLVSFSGVPISGSPFQVFLGAGKAYPYNIIASGPGINSPVELLTADDIVAPFQLAAFDRYGNRKMVGGDKIIVNIIQVESNQPRNSLIEDFDDGDYRVYYNCTVSGMYLVSVTIDTVHISGSPFSPQIYPGVTVTYGCIGIGRNLVVAEIDAVSTFTIQARDQFGNNQRGCNDIFDVEFFGGSLSLGPVRTCGVDPLRPAFCGPIDGMGKTLVTYIATQITTYTAWVTQDGIHISGSPFAIAVSEASRVPDPSKCVAVGRGLTGTLAGHAGTFSIQARNQFGVDLTAGNIDFKVLVAAADGTPFPSAVCSVTYVGPCKPQCAPYTEPCGPGLYKGTYMVTASSNYRVLVTLQSQHITNSPFSVSVLSNLSSTNGTVPAGSGLQSSIAGVLGTFAVRVRDYFGNPQTNPAYMRDNVVCRFDSHPAIFNISQAPIEVFNCRYLLTVTGTYRFRIFLNSAELLSSPYFLRISPNNASALFSYLQAINVTTAGVTSSFTVQTKDQYDNLLTSGRSLSLGNTGIVFSSGCSTASVIGQCLYSPGGRVISVDDLSNGVYTVSYNATASGMYRINVFISGMNIRKSPLLIWVEPSTLDHRYTLARCLTNATNCGRFVATAGSLATFVVAAVDRFGNTISRGGDQVAVNIRSVSYFSASVTDLRNGMHSVSYIVTNAALFRIEVAVRFIFGSGALATNLPISGSPFVAVCFPAAQTWPANCNVYGQGLQNSSVGVPRTVTIEARDVWGNRKTAGSDTFRIILSLNPKPIDSSYGFGDYTDQQDGSYLVTYVVTRAGNYLLDISFRGQTPPFSLTSIKGGPYNLSMAAGPVDPKATTAGGLGLTLSTAGIFATFAISMRDRYGNPQSEGYAGFIVTLKGPAILQGSLALDSTPGSNAKTLKSGYLATVAGQYFMNVMLGQTPVSGSPFQMTTLPGAVRALQSTVQGYGVSPDIAVDKTAQFVVYSDDSFGNQRIVGGDNFVATVYMFKADRTTPTLTATPSTLTDNNDGTYSGVYLVTITGTYRVYITINDEHVRNSPFPVTVNPGSPSAYTTTASGDGIEGGSLVGDTMTFSIIARDTYSNPCTVGGQSASFQIFYGGAATVQEGAAGVPPVDQNDGTYRVSYTSSSQGALSIAIQYSGIPIVGSPFAVQVVGQPGAAVAASSKASGRGILGSIAGCPSNRWCPLLGSPPRDDAGQVLVQARDRYKIALRTGGDVVKANWSAPQAIAVTDQEDGTYALTYSTTIAGRYSLGIYLNGAAIAGSPFSIFINAAAAVPQLSRARIPYSSVCTAGVPGSLAVEAKDQYGNTKLYDYVTVPDSVAGVLSGPDALSATASLNRDTGLFSLFWTANVAGVYNLTVELSSQPIAGNPYMVRVVPGTMDPASCSAFGEGIMDGTAGAAGTFVIQTKDTFGNPSLPRASAGSFFVYSEAYGVTERSAVYPACRDGVTCSGHGVCSRTGGNCVCSGNFAGPNCNACLINWYGAACDVFSWPCLSCNSNGRCVGTAVLTCACMRNWNGSACDRCAQQYYGPTCSIYCDDLLTCGGLGRCSSAGQCVMDRFVGSTSPAVTAAMGVPATSLVTVSGAFRTFVRFGACSLAAASPDPCAAAAHISGSPFAVTVFPGETSAPASALHGPGLVNATAGVPAVFFIRSRDPFGNPVLKGGDPFTVLMSGPKAIKVAPADLGNGTYAATFVAELAGAYDVFARYGNGVVGSPAGREDTRYTTEVIAGPTAGPNCTVQGALSLAVAEAPFTFVIQARDSFGSRKRVGGERFAAALAVPGAAWLNRSATVAAFNVTDLSDGQYLAAVAPRAIGPFVVFAWFQSEGNLSQVSGSPFNLTVEPGPADAATSAALLSGFVSFVDGPGPPCIACDGRRVVRAQAGAVTQLTVVLADAYANPISVTDYSPPPPATAVARLCTACRLGAAQCNCSESEPASPGYVRVLSSSELTFSLVATVAGQYQARVAINSQPLGAAGCASPGVAAILQGTGPPPRPESCGQWASPLSFTVVPASLEPAMCEARGAGLVSHVVSSDPTQGLATFSVFARDRYRNPCTADYGGVFVVLVVGNGPVRRGAIAQSPAELDRYAGSYFPQQAGPYEVHLSAGLSPVPGSPFRLSVVPGPPSALFSTAEGSGLLGAQVGSPALVTLTLMDDFQNVRSADFPNVAAERGTGLDQGGFVVFQRYNRTVCTNTTAGAGEAGGLRCTDVTDQRFKFVEVGGPGRYYTVRDVEGTGKYQLTYQAAAAGQLEFHLLLCDRSCCGDATGACPLLAECVPRQTCDTASCLVAGATRVPCQPIRSVDGGTSPFSVIARPAYIYTRARRSVVSGPGVQKRPSDLYMLQTAGAGAGFVVEARDQYSVRATRGNDSFVARLGELDDRTQDYRGYAPVALTDLGDGAYEGSYAATRAGIYSLSVTLVEFNPATGAKTPATDVGGSGTISPTSPFNPIVVLPAATDPAASRATPPATARAGSRSLFPVQPADRFGNPQAYPDVDPSGNNLTAASFNDNVTAELTGPGAATAGVAVFPACALATAVLVRLSCSPFQVQFEATVAGSYQLAVRVNGAALPGSPFRVTITAGAPSPALTRAVGSGLSLATAGVSSTVLLTVYDAFENPVNLSRAGALGPFSGLLLDGGWRPACMAPGAEARPQCAGALALQNANSSLALGVGAAGSDNQTAYNSVVITYTPTASGAKTLAIQYSGAHLAGSPYGVVVRNGEVNASFSSAAGLGMQGAVAGESVSVTVSARDDFGNLMSDALQQFDVVLEGPAVIRAGLARAAPGGAVFEYAYAATRAGAYRVSVTTLGAHLDGSPATVRVLPGGAAAPQSVLVSAGGFTGTAGVVASLRVSARDLYGNPLGAGGDLFLAEIVNPVTARTVIVPTDDGDGNYTLSFASGLAGMHVLSVSLGSVNIFGSPYAWAVVPGRVSPANCQTYYSATVVAGDVNVVLITARDRFGNLLSDGSLAFALAVANSSTGLSAANLTAGVFFPVPGAYIVSPILTLQDPYSGNFSLTVSGNYTGAVYLLTPSSGAPGGVVRSAVGGSPFNFTAVPATADTAACFAVGAGLSR
jgi:hypothetical protein